MGRIGRRRGAPCASIAGMRTPKPLPDHLRGQVFAVADARERGVTASRLRARDLHTPHRGVRMPLPPQSLIERCRAYAVSVGDGVVFCGSTAAQMLGIPLPRQLEDGALHVVQRWTDRAPRGGGLVGHKTRREVEIIEQGGVRMTAPIATWFALAQELTLDDLIVAGDRLIGGRSPLVTPEELRIAVADHTRARGARRIREAYFEVRSGSWSPQETRVRLSLVRAGLPEPELNAPIDLGGDHLYHGDIVYRARRLVLEYEGRHHLTDPAQWAHDLERYNAYASSGWTAIRIAKEMPTQDIVAQVRRLLAS